MAASAFPPPPNRNGLERDIQRLERDVLRMGALVEQSFRLSHEALFQRDLSAAEQIPLLDKQIDRFYRAIEADCVMLMSLQMPVARDSRQLGALMQLVRDLERIGDYAKDLGEIALKLFPYPLQPWMPEVEQMSLHARAMLAKSLAALGNLDAEAGRQMKDQDTTVDDAYDRVYRSLAYQRDFKGILEPALLVMLAIRHIERMADHATNIGQRVAYIVTGVRN